MKHHASNESGATEVYYDGDCPMCTALMGRIKDSGEAKQFTLHNIVTEKLPAGIIKAQVEKEIHVIDESGTVHKNADAILVILERYPKWRLVTRVARLPLVRMLLPLGYRFIAANRRFLFGPASRIYFAKQVTILGFISGILLTFPLWVSVRVFPLVPVMNGFSSFLTPLGSFTPVILVSLLAFAFISSRPRYALLGAAAFTALLVCADVTRLHPWVYQYAVMLLVLGLFSFRIEDTKGQLVTTTILRFIVVIIYTWSGLQKINILFFSKVFPWMVAPVADLLPSAMHPLVFAFGFLVPLIEIGIGVGLIFARSRRAALLLAGCMCVFVLSVLGPLGHDYNSSVWPWNVALLLLAVILFAGTKEVSAREMFRLRRSITYALVMLFFGILPALSCWNAWDSYLSWSMYSGTTNDATLVISRDALSRMPTRITSYAQEGGSGWYMLPIASWAMGELNVPPYPEARAYISIARNMCVYAKEPGEVLLDMKGRSSWFKKERREVIDCTQLR